jgi:hypothetical protein
MYIPKLRKKDKVINDIRKIDPNTALTTTLITKMIRKGEISKIDYGNAQLVNLDELAEFFSRKEQK